MVLYDVARYLSSAAVGLRSGQAESGVEDRVEDVGDQVEEDDEHGKDEEHGRHDRRVAVPDGRHEQLADAGDAEDLLGHDSAAEDRRDPERDERDHRDEAVPEDMAGD